MMIVQVIGQKRRSHVPSFYYSITSSLTDPTHIVGTKLDFPRAISRDFFAPD